MSAGLAKIDGAASITSNFIFQRRFETFIKSTVISHPNVGSKCERLMTVQLRLNYVVKKTKWFIRFKIVMLNHNRICKRLSR